jgi:hypothetical protein
MKKIDGLLEYKDSSFLQLTISWYDMEFTELVDSIGINNEANIVSSHIKKESDSSIINLNETDLESLEMQEKGNFVKLMMVSGHFGEFDRKKSKKNIEIVVNCIGEKGSLLNVIKL